MKVNAAVECSLLFSFEKEYFKKVTGKSIENYIDDNFIITLSKEANIDSFTNNELIYKYTIIKDKLSLLYTKDYINFSKNIFLLTITNIRDF